MAIPRAPVSQQGAAARLHVPLRLHRRGQEGSARGKHLLPDPRRYVEVPLGGHSRGASTRLLRTLLRCDSMGRHTGARLLERAGTAQGRHHEMGCAHLRQPARHLLPRGEGGRLEGGSDARAQGQALHHLQVPQRSGFLPPLVHPAQGVEGAPHIRQLRRRR